MINNNTLIDIEKFNISHFTENIPENAFISNSKKIQNSQRMIRENSSKSIVFSSPLISYNDNGVIFPNTINIIQGKKGVHKSRLTEIFCSMMLNRTLGNKYLGMKRNPTVMPVVLYVDTERNIQDQFPFAIQKIKVLSGMGIAENPSNLDYISLIDVPRKERFDTLSEYIRQFREKHPTQILFIVFDVVTDCVENFNGVPESMKLVDMLNETINYYNVTFLCVIHENPGLGNDKGRGHLGTELNNKASQVMQISFEKDAKGRNTDLISLKFLHSRNTKAIEPIFIQYSNESKSLILAEPEFVAEKLAQKKEKAQKEDVKLWISENLLEPRSKEEIVIELKDYFECGTRIIEDRLKALTHDGHIDRYLNGKKAFYKLIA